VILIDGPRLCHTQISRENLELFISQGCKSIIWPIINYLQAILIAGRLFQLSILIIIEARLSILIYLLLPFQLLGK
jgi:hypothetical protein